MLNIYCWRELEMDKSLGKSLALSAYRLSEPFCQVYKTRKQQFTTERFGALLLWLMLMRGRGE